MPLAAKTQQHMRVPGETRSSTRLQNHLTNGPQAPELLDIGYGHTFLSEEKTEEDDEKEPTRV